MARSLEEIRADIAATEAEIARRKNMDESLSRETPEYRAARFDYIVDDDRAGMDAFIGRIRQAQAAKAQREAQQAQLAAQQEFQMKQLGEQQKFQAAENEKNRQVQREVRDYNKAVEGAKARNQAQQLLDMAAANYDSLKNDNTQKAAARAKYEYALREAARVGLPNDLIDAHFQALRGAPQQPHPASNGNAETKTTATIPDYRSAVDLVGKKYWEPGDYEKAKALAVLDYGGQFEVSDLQNKIDEYKKSADAKAQGKEKWNAIVNAFKGLSKMDLLKATGGKEKWSGVLRGQNMSVAYEPTAGKFYLLDEKGKATGYTIE